MKSKLILAFLFILILSSIAAADIIISKSKVSRIPTDKIEVGSSPEINIQFKNTTGRKVELSSVDLYLTYDPSVIDVIITIANLKPENLQVKAMNIYTPGEISYKLGVSSADPKYLKIGKGETIDLATIVVHVNQQAPARTINLFNWSIENISAVYDKYELLITGSLADPAKIAIEKSSPPEFTGLSSVISANALGVQNPGNTLVLDWRTPGAGAYDLTRFYDGKLSFKVFKRTEDTDWQEISGEQPYPNQYADPIERYPYTGNTNIDYIFEDAGLDDGTTYLYKVTAIDDTSPKPNEKTDTAIISGIPLDMTPPGEVTNLTANVGDNLITLKWENPKDEDLSGVLIMKNEGKPVAERSLGSANATGDGPAYDIGEPFGSGNGMVIYVSPQDQNPNEFSDHYAQNGVESYYKVFTYDRATPGPPRESGRNYSKGVSIIETPGVPPRPITNFRTEGGEFPGEILLLWNNSADNFSAGTLIRFSDDDNLKFAALKNVRMGQPLPPFPTYGGPGELDGYYVTGFEPEKTYYFKAYTFNKTPEGIDPSDLENMARHRFSDGVTASIFLPAIVAKEAAPEIPPAAEPAPQIRVWFEKRLYSQTLVDKGIKFYIPNKPTIKMEVSIAEDYNLDPEASNYTFTIDGFETHAFSSATIQKNKAIFEVTLPEALTPGKHTFTFNAQSSGVKAAATSISETVTVTVTGGPLNIIDRPICFPSPFNPELHKFVTLQYTLNYNANIDLIIISVAGQIVRRIYITAGEEGGVGQLNKVTWDGMTDQGTVVASGLYLVNIVSRDEKRSLGQLKLTVYR